METQGEFIDFLTREVENAAYKEISDVEAFVKWLDKELSYLVDERAVLKHFPKWPEQKADTLREAAFSYRDLKNLESEILSFKDNQKQPLPQALQRMQALQERCSLIRVLTFDQYVNYLSPNKIKIAFLQVGKKH